MITPRLRVLLENVTQGVLADIGTDHGYLPILAVRKNLCERAIACDIARAPLLSAEKNIREAGLASRIETRLGDGLQPVAPGEADCIVIAGMGGKNIMKIIGDAGMDFFRSNGAVTPRLVLGAQHDIEELRRFLHANSFEICKERLVCEDGRFYIVLNALWAQNVNVYSEKEYFAGKISDPFYFAYLQEQHAKISRYIDAVTNEEAKNLARKRLKWLEELCLQHKE